MGADFKVTAIFIQPKFLSSISGPHDSELTLGDIEVIGPDGFDCSNDMKDIFSWRKNTISPLKIVMVSILCLIDEEALNQYLNGE